MKWYFNKKELVKGVDLPVRAKVFLTIGNRRLAAVGKNYCGPLKYFTYLTDCNEGEVMAIIIEDKEGKHLNTSVLPIYAFPYMFRGQFTLRYNRNSKTFYWVW